MTNDGRQRQNPTRKDQHEAEETTGRFSGDVPGGGQSQDTNLGSDGSSMPTGDVGTGVRQPDFPRTPKERQGQPIDAKAHRSSTNLVPGVPDGDGDVPDLEPLEGTREEDKPDADTVRREDRERNTL